MSSASALKGYQAYKASQPKSHSLLRLTDFSVQVKNLPPETEAELFLVALAALTSLKLCYEDLEDSLAIDQITQAIFNIEESVKRAFNPNFAENLIAKALEAAKLATE